MTTVEPATVEVSWHSVDIADRYTVTFTKTLGDEQQGLCTGVNSVHSASITVSTSPATIDVGQDVGIDVTNMLRAYTTYFITVAAVSDILGNSEESEAVELTTIQTSTHLSV